MKSATQRIVVIGLGHFGSRAVAGNATAPGLLEEVAVPGAWLGKTLGEL